MPSSQSSSTSQTTSEPQPSLDQVQVTTGLPATLGIFALIGWSIISVCVRSTKKGQSRVSSLASTVPCRNCRYFHNNQYLKCSVNPIVALTKEAEHCSDYDPVAKKQKGTRHFKL